MSRINKTIVAVLASITMLESPLTVFAAEGMPSAQSSSVQASESSPVEQEIPKGHAYLPKGVVLTVELMTEASSAKLHEGDHLPVRLAQNLILNGVVIAPVGTRVDTIVTKVSKARGFGHSGKLEFVTEHVAAVNGAKIPLRAHYEKRHGNEDGAWVVFTAVSMIGGAFMKGKNVVVPARTQFQAEVAENTDLGVPWDGLADAMDPEKPHGVEITVAHP